MATIEKKTKRYPSDLTDEEWLAIEPCCRAGRARAQANDRFARGGERDPLHGAVGLRVADAADPFSAVADGLLVVSPVRPSLLFRTIHDLAVMIDRERAGREASPSAG